ncbi:MAG: amino acid ABC transporter permease [Promethearchaeota archaeon]
MLFQGIIFSVLFFPIGMYVMRWYAHRKHRNKTELGYSSSGWISSSNNANLIINLLLFIIDIPIFITFKLLNVVNLLPISNLFLFLIILYGGYFLVNLVFGSIIVSKFYKKRIGESFFFVLIIQLILFGLAVILSLLFAFLSNAPYPDFFDIFYYIISVGLGQTLLLTSLGLIFGFIIGLGLALMRVYGGIELNFVGSLYEKIFRGIPLLVLIYLFAFGVRNLTALSSVVLALALRSGAYQSQIFRGAILSVNPGQLEAANSLGMNRAKAFRYVVLPQALRLAIPSWSNEYAVVIKDTSFAYAVGLIEMTRAAYYVSVMFRGLWAFSMAVVAITYFIFTFPITRIIGERQSKKLEELGMIGG